MLTFWPWVRPWVCGAAVSPLWIACAAASPPDSKPNPGEQGVRLHQVLEGRGDQVVPCGIEGRESVLPDDVPRQLRQCRARLRGQAAGHRRGVGRRGRAGLQPGGQRVDRRFVAKRPKPTRSTRRSAVVKLAATCSAASPQATSSATISGADPIWDTNSPRRPRAPSPGLATGAHDGANGNAQGDFFLCGYWVCILVPRRRQAGCGPPFQPSFGAAPCPVRPHVPKAATRVRRAGR
jgi:hypothetical protein